MKTAIAALFVMFALSACSSSATLVLKDGISGRIALRGAYMPAMADARVLMTEHCDGRYQMIETKGAVEFRCGQSAAPAGDAHAVARNGADRRF